MKIQKRKSKKRKNDDRKTEEEEFALTDRRWTKIENRKNEEVKIEMQTKEN